MSNRYDDLVLHLKLDDIDLKKNTTPDSSNSHLSAAVQGVDLVEDDTFGSCVNFDGQNDQVDVSNLGLSGANPAHTIEAWIKVEAYPQARAWILLLGQSGAGSHHWLLNAENAGNDLGKKAQLGAWGGMQARPIVPLAKWVHIAVAYDDRSSNLACYLNGQLIDKPKAKFDLSNNRLTLAKRETGEKNFQGKMAHVRVYRRALSEAEISEDMDTDRLAQPAYRSGHPISFSLRDEDENQVLYIGDNPGDHHRLKLELRNKSAQAIRFQKQGDQASEDKYHFELVFRNDVLSDKTLELLRKSKNEIVPKNQAEKAKWENQWDLFCPAREDSQTGTISVYFLYKDTEKPFGPNTSLVIPLRNISANPGSGARGAQIELKLNRLTYDGETTPITGFKIQHLQIISHLGSRRVPLHVSFVGSNRILNDGSSPNTLVLQLMNVLKSEGDTSVRLTEKSEFRISFDVQSSTEVAPWSLCTYEEIGRIKAEKDIFVANIDQYGDVEFDSKGNAVSDTGLWKVDPTSHGQDQTPVWSIKPRQDIVLRYDKYIQIYISNIKTSLPSGLTNLYLDYKNIPGFWDGQVVCPIEKAPLLFYDVRAAKAGFWVSQRVRDYIARTFPEFAQKFPESSSRAYWSSEERDYLVNQLQMSRFYLGRAVDASQHEPVKLEQAKKSLAENVAAANELAHMQIPYTGELRVGIGCVEPKAKLEIALSAKDADTNPLVIRKGEVNYLTILKDGKVGIGTQSPQNQLHSSAALLNVAVASQSTNAGIAIAQGQGVNVTLQAEPGGGYIGTASNHHLKLVSNNAPRVWVMADGKVAIGHSVPHAQLSILGGLHVIQGGLHLGGESDPGNKNLLVSGKASIKEGLHVGGESDPGDKKLLVSGKAAIKGGLHVGGESDPGEKDLLVGGKATVREGLHVGAPLPAGAVQAGPGHQLVVHGSAFLVGSLKLDNSIRLVHTATNKYAAEIALEPALVFKTVHQEKSYDSLTVHPPVPGGDAPTLTVAGHISERLDVIKIEGRGDWSSANHPIKIYFSQRLRGKPPGTMLRAITDYQTSYRSDTQDWRGHWWTGWVDANGQIRVIHNHRNTDQIAPQNPGGSAGVVVYADR